jgi:nitrogen fixation protein NifB
MSIPGNASRVLSPEEALDLLERALILCPELKVAGVAGPGEPLAGPEALDTLIKVKRAYPELITCLSTNGLALADSLTRILEAGIETLTVTVNAVKAEILAQINAVTIIDGQALKGLQGAKALLEAQERGLRLAKEKKITIKVNMVLIPGINQNHVDEVAQKVKAWGASLINIIAMIPGGAFKNITTLSDEELNEARAIAGKSLRPILHCARCRADACGIPGVSDYAKELYQNLPQTETFSHG